MKNGTAAVTQTGDETLTDLSTELDILSKLQPENSSQSTGRLEKQIRDLSVKLEVLEGAWTERSTEMVKALKMCNLNNENQKLNQGSNGAISQNQLHIWI